jgi:sortase (surface protein transpeptidase)
VLVAALLLGVGLVVHSVYTVSTARREPSSFSVPAVVAAAARSTPVQSNASAPAHARAYVRPNPPVAEFVATRLRISGLKVTAPVVPVASAQHTLTPPEDPSQVGWWVASAPAGARQGSIVIVGHIDSAASGPGALFHLDRIKPGQTIDLSSGSKTARYRTTSMRFYPKSAGLPADLFNPAGPARLVLISCGGTFDRAKRSYRSNVVVIGTPTAAAATPNGS